MRTLKFVVNGQNLKKDKACDFDNIIRGSTGYLNAQFSFDSNWIGMTKAAEFRAFGKPDTYPVLIRDGVCDVPAEVSKEKMWTVLVVGKRGNERLPTNMVTVKQEG